MSAVRSVLYVVVAKNHYTAKATDEVSVRKGDILNVLDKNDDRLHVYTPGAQAGWIPEKFTIIFNSDPPKEKNYRYSAMALEDFDSSDPKMLSFKAGEVVAILSGVPGGYWSARNSNGKVGLVPQSHFTLTYSEARTTHKINLKCNLFDMSIPTPLLAYMTEDEYNNALRPLREYVQNLYEDVGKKEGVGKLVGLGVGGGIGAVAAIVATILLPEVAIPFLIAEILANVGIGFATGAAGTLAGEGIGFAIGKAIGKAVDQADVKKKLKELAQQVTKTFSSRGCTLVDPTVTSKDLQEIEWVVSLGQSQGQKSVEVGKDVVKEDVVKYHKFRIPEREQTEEWTKWSNARSFYPKKKWGFPVRMTIVGHDGIKGAAKKLHFSCDGLPVPVLQNVTEDVELTSDDSELLSFKILTPTNHKYILAVTPSEGTLAAGSSITIHLALQVMCTTLAKLKIPVVFWRGGLDKRDDVIDKLHPSENVFVYQFEGKIKSQLSMHLDIDDLEYAEPSLGSGSFGTVYRATYRSQIAAAKVMNVTRALSPKDLDMFRNEVGLMETIRSPNVVNYLGSVALPSALIIVTELCQYGSLDSALKKYGPKVWNSTLKVKAMYDVACAMDFLHRSSIIHRDLKSANALVVSLDPKSQVVCKVSDFGTSKVFHASMMSSKTSSRDTLCGTIKFMAPEMLSEEETYTLKVDVYSYAIMMLEVLNDGVIDFDFNFNPLNPFSFVRNILRGGRPVIAKPNDAPPGYLDLMRKCWYGDPEMRPSFEVIAKRMKAILDQVM